MTAATAPLPPARAHVIAAQIEAAAGVARLRELYAGDIGPDLTSAILGEASKFADAILTPLNTAADRIGCRVQDGRVVTAPGHREAWAAFLEAGWLGIDQPEAEGGMGLPMLATAACQEVFDRSCIAFGMLSTAQRAAARLLAAHADDQIKGDWLPRLISGEWAATICISEPEAGSDVGRIRTLAEPLGGGDWSITGEKIWISYGDHDLAPRVGHCLLARTPGAATGAGGLSLFLVPASGEDRNGVVVRRIEEKLGLHGSPTCALGFEASRGRLIGAEGRGLSQLFTMITTMRLMVAVQGLAVASAAADTALAYAGERRQGGRPDAPPVAISDHPDVRRLLLGMTSRVEALRGVILAAAAYADLARLEPDAEARGDADALVGWLLPIAKTYGGETAFEVASDAIQVLGGAGYVKDWPVEQQLRDCRVFTIFEGTSGMQALDLLQRRLRRDQGRGLAVFLKLARADLHALGPSPALARTLDLLEDAASRLSASQDPSPAYAFLKLAAYAATGWSALRLTASGHPRLKAAGRYWLSDLDAKADFEHAQVGLDPVRLELFEQL